jgi:hypothetical protein
MLSFLKKGRLHSAMPRECNVLCQRTRPAMAIILAVTTGFNLQPVAL